MIFPLSEELVVEVGCPTRGGSFVPVVEFKIGTLVLIFRIHEIQPKSQNQDKVTYPGIKYRLGGIVLWKIRLPCSITQNILHMSRPDIFRIPNLRRVWLVKPNEGLSTPVVFRHLEYDQLSRVEPGRLLTQFMEKGVAVAEYVNDLEAPAFKAMPSLRQMKLELQVNQFGSAG